MATPSIEYLIATTSTESEYLKDLLQQVPVIIFGLFVGLLFMRELIVAGRTHRALMERESAARVENAELRKALEEKILPALIRAGDLTEKTISALDTTTATLTSMGGLLAEATDVIPRGTQSLETFNSQLSQLDAVLARFEADADPRVVAERHADIKEVLERVIKALENWE